MQPKRLFLGACALSILLLSQPAQSMPVSHDRLPEQVTSHAPWPQVTPPAHDMAPLHVTVQAVAPAHSTPPAHAPLEPHSTWQLHPVGHTTGLGQLLPVPQSNMQVLLATLHEVHSGGQGSASGAGR